MFLLLFLFYTTCTYWAQSKILPAIVSDYMETLFSNRAIFSDYMETLFSDRAIVSDPTLQWFLTSDPAIVSDPRFSDSWPVIRRSSAILRFSNSDPDQWSGDRQRSTLQWFLTSDPRLSVIPRFSDSWPVILRSSAIKRKLGFRVIKNRIYKCH